MKELMTKRFYVILIERNYIKIYKHEYMHKYNHYTIKINIRQVKKYYQKFNNITRSVYLF